MCPAQRLSAARMESQCEFHEMRKTNLTCKVPECSKSAKCRQMCVAHYKRFMRHGGELKGRIAKGARLEWLKSNLSFTGRNCLIPPFHKRGGYWQFQSEGKSIYAHRWMCEAKNGPAPSARHHAAHSCGNGHLGCVNPGHLRWATPRENCADTKKHGRLIFGEKQHASKLTRQDVDEIMVLRGAKSQSQIAKLFGVSRSTVGRVLSGEAWKHYTVRVS